MDPIVWSRTSADAGGMGPLLLTVPQARFARDHDATPGGWAKDGSVFLYHEEPGSSFRWLVAPDGDVLETETFAEQP
jgi:hypothetical protein